MFDQESAFLLRAGFGKMAAFDSFSDLCSKSNFYRKATTLNVRQDIFGKLNRQAHVGQVLFSLLRRVLDPNSRVLGDGLFAVEVSYNKSFVSDDNLLWEVHSDGKSLVEVDGWISAIAVLAHLKPLPKPCSLLKLSILPPMLLVSTNVFFRW